MKLYKDKRSGELVLVGNRVFITKHPLVSRWKVTDSLLVEREISNGNLVLIGNNFRRK